MTRNSVGQRRTILVVDDNRLFRALVVETLEGCSVEEAEDGPTGVQKALGNDYDLILMDNRLPGYRADEAIRRIIARKPRQRIIVVTGSPGDDSVQRALEHGALTCLAKPFDIEDVVRWVQ